MTGEWPIQAGFWLEWDMPTTKAVATRCLMACSVHYPSVDTFFIRPALISERSELEDLQRRASLNNAGDRDAILAHPDAIELPLQQIAAGRVFVSEQNGAMVGFAAVEPRADGESELDALFVDPGMQRHGIGRQLLAHGADFS
jgi:ribosomal protein S18 acetylase RimI-like enzyme